MAKPIDLTKLVGDNVFQLNSLLWMLTPTQEELGLTPLLLNAGFRLSAINPDLNLDPGTIARLTEAQIKSNRSCCPEVVIYRKQDKKSALVECKRDGFGLDSSNCEQARALILAAALKDQTLTFLEPHTACHLIFFVSHPAGERMRASLDGLNAEFDAAGFPTALADASEFQVIGKQVGIVLQEGFAQHCGMQPGWTPFLDVDEVNDPRPLYFIPLEVDADAGDFYGRQQLLERIRVSITKRVAVASGTSVVTMTFEDAANEATFGMFERLRKRAAKKCWKSIFCRMVRELNEHLLKRNLSALSWNGMQQQWSVQFFSEETRKRFLKELWYFVPPYDDVFEVLELPFEDLPAPAQPDASGPPPI